MEKLRIPMVAIVDDDGAMRASTVSLMRSAGYHAECFASGKDLLDSAWLDETAIVITDLQMPGMTGLQLQELLRSRGYTMPVIFITAYPEERTRHEAFAAGAVGFFSKPFDGTALLGCIDDALNRLGDDKPS
jgi:FixJ family two-component response regulator